MTTDPNSTPTLSNFFDELVAGGIPEDYAGYLTGKLVALVSTAVDAKTLVLLKAKYPDRTKHPQMSIPELDELFQESIGQTMGDFADTIAQNLVKDFQAQA